MLADFGLTGFLFSLVALSWGTQYFLSRFISKNKVLHDWRVSFLMGVTIWTFLIVIVTESLNLTKSITTNSIAFIWILIAVGATLGALLLSKSYKISFKTTLKNLTNIEWLMIGGVVLFLVTTFVVGLRFAPTGTDSYTYHLPRVMHWIQNRSVDFYQTDVLRQLYQAPAASYITMHLQILKGSNSLLFFAQWIGYVGCILATSYLAKLFSLSRFYQIVTAVVTATIPMLVLQANSTQTDAITSMWVIISITFIIITIRNFHEIFLVFTAMAFGLALLTKATSYIFLAPFILWVIYILLKQNWSKRLIYGFLFVIIVLLINAPFSMRNYELFGVVLGPGSNGEYEAAFANETKGVRVTTSNIIKNTAIHFKDYYGILQPYALSEVIKIHDYIGISPHDPRVNYLSISFGISRQNHANEDTSANLVHTVLILISLLLLPILIYRRKTTSIQILYALSVIFAVVLFSAYLKWQPWHSRLQLPFFVMFSPVIVYSVTKYSKKFVPIVMVIFLLMRSFTYATNNIQRPLDTTVIYEYGRSTTPYHPAYRNAANFAKKQKCSNIGLSGMLQAGVIYPFWAQLNEPLHTRRLEYINAKNPSQRYSTDFQPCLIIIGSEKYQYSEFEYNNIVYQLAWEEENGFKVYLRK